MKISGDDGVNSMRQQLPVSYVAQKANPGKQGLSSLLSIFSHSLLQMGLFPWAQSISQDQLIKA